MSNLFETIEKGGPTMIPLVGMSIATIACALERSWFWFRLMTQEERVAQEVMEAARFDLSKAAEIASQAQHLAIGRFLLAPLKLNQPTPETFGLAMEAAANREFIQMRKGDKLLESIVGLAPLLGLLGTVTGLIATFASLKLGGGGSSADTTKAAAGIGEALIATAAGMIVAIMSLVIFRVMVTLQSRQVDYFERVGSELELIYREIWYEPTFHSTTHQAHGDYSTPSNVQLVDS